MDEAEKNDCCQSGVVQRMQKKYQLEPLASWITLFAAFMVHITVAAPDTFGIFYEHFIQKYETSRSDVGWVMAVYVVSGSLSSIITSPVLSTLGCRPVAVAMSTIFALGMSLTAIAPNLAWLIVFYGAIGGIGGSGILLCSSTVIQQAFSQNRGLATGLSSFGFTAGTTLCPILAEYLLLQYSLEGALLLFSALFVQAIVCAALLKSPKGGIVESPKDRNVALDDHDEGLPGEQNLQLEDETAAGCRSGLNHQLDHPNTSDSLGMGQDDDHPAERNLRSLSDPDHLTNYNSSSELDEAVKLNLVIQESDDSQDGKVAHFPGKSGHLIVNEVDKSDKSNSKLLEEDCVDCQEERNPGHLTSHNANLEVDRQLESSSINHVDDDSHEEKIKRLLNENNSIHELDEPVNDHVHSLEGQNSQLSGESDQFTRSNSNHELGKPVNLKSINLTHQEERDSQLLGEPKHFTQNNPNIELDEQVKFTLMKDKEEVLEKPDTTGRKETFKLIIDDMKDFSLMKQWPYLLSLAFFTLNFSCGIAMIAHTVGGALHIGLKQQESAYLMTIMGLSNFTFRIISTAIMNFSWFNSLWYTALGSIFLTCAALVAAFASDYGLFVVAVVFMGAGEGVTNTVESIVIVDVVGVPNVAKSITFTRVFSMPFLMGAAPFGGWLVDVTGAYTVLFIVVGALSGVSVLLILGTDLLLRRARREEEEETASVAITDCTVL